MNEELDDVDILESYGLDPTIPYPQPFIVWLRSASGQDLKFEPENVNRIARIADVAMHRCSRVEIESNARDLARVKLEFVAFNQAEFELFKSLFRFDGNLIRD